MHTLNTGPWLFDVSLLNSPQKYPVHSEVLSGKGLKHVRLVLSTERSKELHIAHELIETLPPNVDVAAQTVKQGTLSGKQCACDLITPGPDKALERLPPSSFRIAPAK